MLFLRASSVTLQGTGGTVVEFIVLIAFCPPRINTEKSVLLTFETRCSAMLKKQSVYNTRTEFRFRRHEFPALREERGFELTFRNNQKTGQDTGSDCFPALADRQQSI